MPLARTARALTVLLLSAVQASAQSSYLDLLIAGHSKSPSEIARLESSLISNPDNLSARATLISYYFQNAMAQPRLEHVLWVIRHHPESKLAGSPVAAISARPGILNTLSDYERARTEWLAQVEAHPRNPDVLTNAGRFFESDEPMRAESLLKKAWQLDPENKMRLAELSSFYASKIMACERGTHCPDPSWIARVKSDLESPLQPELTDAVAAQLRRFRQLE